jgi:DNA-directed RNA polymerase specialized sigma24 family protein
VLAPESVASRAFELVRQFDSATLAVFREYCLAGHSAAETARKLHSSKSAVMRRLKLIRAKTGLAPARLRALSSHFEKMRDDLTNPNAKHIRPTNLIYDDSGPAEPQE